MGVTSSAFRNEGLQMLRAAKSSKPPDSNGFFGYTNALNSVHFLSTENGTTLTAESTNTLSPQMLTPDDPLEDTMQAVRLMAKTEIGDGYDEKMFDKYFPAFYRIAQRALFDTRPLNTSICSQSQICNNSNEIFRFNNTTELLKTEQELHSDETECTDFRTHETAKPQCVDGYRWRKYGEKKTRMTGFVRSYYKCVEKGCNARKILQTKDGVVHHSLTKYFSLPHNHPSNIRRVSQRKRGKRNDALSKEKENSLPNSDPIDRCATSSPVDTPITASSSPNSGLCNHIDVVSSDTTYDEESFEMELFL